MTTTPPLPLPTRRTLAGIRRKVDRAARELEQASKVLEPFGGVLPDATAALCLMASRYAATVAAKVGRVLEGDEREGDGNG